MLKGWDVEDSSPNDFDLLRRKSRLEFWLAEKVANDVVDEIYRGTVKKLVAREIAPQTETAINFFLKVGLNDKAWKKGDISEEMSSLLALDDKSRTPRSQRSDFSEELDESFIDSETRERLRHMTKEEARRVVKLMKEEKKRSDMLSQQLAEIEKKMKEEEEARQRQRRELLEARREKRLQETTERKKQQEQLRREEKQLRKKLQVSKPLYVKIEQATASQPPKKSKVVEKPTPNKKPKREEQPTPVHHLKKAPQAPPPPPVVHKPLKIHKSKRLGVIAKATIESRRRAEKEREAARAKLQKQLQYSAIVKEMFGPIPAPPPQPHEAEKKKELGKIELLSPRKMFIAPSKTVITPPRLPIVAPPDTLTESFKAGHVQNQKVVRLTQGIEALKKKLDEIERMSHKKEEEIGEGASMKKLEKKIDKRIMVTNMYIDTIKAKLSSFVEAMGTSEEATRMAL